MTKFNDNFLRACKIQPVDHTPVWYMRQAGRYQPEYRAIKKKYSLIEIVKHPEVCTEVTLLPVQQLGVDAAILFSDIMTPIESMGIPNEIKANYGPHISSPIRTTSDVEKIVIPEFEEAIPYVGKTIELLRQELNVPLIGFCGAPFTLASYIIEGGPSKNYSNTKMMMYAAPKDWHALMEKLSSGMANYLAYQVKSGTQALQIFDSWVGNLSLLDYEQYIFPHMKNLFAQLKEKNVNVPIIHFGVNTSHLLEKLKEAGGDVIGLDWKTDITDAWKRLGYEVAVQGNLDPGLLHAPWELLKERVDLILNQANRNGFIFNLGHGITPDVRVDVLKKLTEYVHQFKIK